jgi:carboxylate-amine ligase
MHVHVEIGSQDEGVAVIDRIAPWLPTLLALSANSPFVDGRDTRYASWRAQLWARWPTAGPTERFGSLAGYREVCRMLLDSGAARDEGMFYFDARLSAGQPTVEVRVSDVCTDPDDAIAVAVLARALVETAATEWAEESPLTPWRAEALRAAQWRASRFGVADQLIDPSSRELRPARAVVEALVDAVRPALEEAGDLDGVLPRLERILHGGGAARQRAAYERSGTVQGVVDDLIDRTERSWRDHDIPTGRL